MIKENLIQLFADSFRKNWNLPAYTDYVENKTLNYSDVASEVARLHLLFDEINLQQGDKVALLGKNSTNWALIYIATITYGAVIVPILHEFNPSDIVHILEHSESKVLFADSNLLEKIANSENSFVKNAFSLNDFSVVKTEKSDFTKEHWENVFTKKYPKGFSQSNIKYAKRANAELASLNYTSGTTGYSKGVMLSGNALAGNITFGIETQLLQPLYKIVAFLPFAHAYGCAFDFLTATCTGCHIYIITKAPTPALLLEAFAKVCPNIIFSVPMIIEKVYQKKIIPTLANPFINLIFHTPLLGNILKKSICRKLKNAFGGNFSEIIVGGAAMNPKVEDFFVKIAFPITIGYGMTECAPLISYTDYKEFKPKSCGKVLHTMEVKTDETGEICVRGENLMNGYYKNPEATANSIDAEGWFHTGDLGTTDADGTIYIKGRSKTMILSSNGQNIYPEEIEAKLAMLPLVAECLVVLRNRKLVALVYPDFAAINEQNIDADALEKIMENNRAELNRQVANYEKISKIQLTKEEFEKTPKKSIKRFLYK